MTLFVERQTIFRRTSNDCSSNVKRLFFERQTMAIRLNRLAITVKRSCDYSEKSLRYRLNRIAIQPISLTKIGAACEGRPYLYNIMCS